MWKIMDAKRKSISVMKRSYLAMLLVSLILVFSGGSTSYSSFKVNFNFGGTTNIKTIVKDIEANEKVDSNTGFDSANFDEDLDNIKFSNRIEDLDFGDIFNEISSQMDEGEREAFTIFSSVFFVVMIIIMLLVLSLKIFVLNPLGVGCWGYFIKNNRKGESDLNQVGAGFKRDSYMPVVKSIFRKNLYLFFWSLISLVGLLVFMLLTMSATYVTDLIWIIMLTFIVMFIGCIPVIIKRYSYRLVGMIVSDNPEIGSKRAIELSRQMMDGHKFKNWVFDLSFIGWYFLGALLLGFGICLVHPYYNGAMAEVYEKLRKNALESGIAEAWELGYSVDEEVVEELVEDEQTSGLEDRISLEKKDSEDK